MMRKIINIGYVVKGNIGDGEEILVRVHSECLTGDIFGSARCDCGKQLGLAMRKIEEGEKGVLVYLRGQEGRGIGLGNKLLAYNLQDAGRDTVQANQDLGLPVDSRDYTLAAQVCSPYQLLLKHNYFQSTTFYRNLQFLVLINHV